MKRATLAILIATSATAYADDHHVGSDMHIFMKETTYILNDPFRKKLSEYPANACANRHAKAKAAGVSADQEYRFFDIGKVRFADLPARICAPYERAVHIAEAVQLLDRTKDGKHCAAEMDRLLKFGIGDEEFEIRDVVLKLSEGKAKICDPIARGEPISAEEKKQARAAAAVPYEEAGITGAKLTICAVNTTKIRLAGGATPTPRDIRRASLLFILNNPAKDKYELTRIEFKGDEILKISEKSFAAPPAADDYR